MTLKKLDQASADIDDASTTIEELQAEPDAIDATDKLKEVHETLAHASDALDEERDDEEDDDKDEGEDEGEAGRREARRRRKASRCPCRRPSPRPQHLPRSLATVPLPER